MIEIPNQLQNHHPVKVHEVRPSMPLVTAWVLHRAGVQSYNLIIVGENSHNMDFELLLEFPHWAPHTLLDPSMWCSTPSRVRIQPCCPLRPHAWILSGAKKPPAQPSAHRCPAPATPCGSAGHSWTFHWCKALWLPLEVAAVVRDTSEVGRRRSS